MGDPLTTFAVERMENAYTIKKISYLDILDWPV